VNHVDFDLFVFLCGCFDPKYSKGKYSV